MYRLDQAIDLFGDGVTCTACTDKPARKTQPFHHGARIEVTARDENAATREVARNIIGGVSVNRKCYRRRPRHPRLGSIQLDSRESRQTLPHSAEEGQALYMKRGERVLQALSPGAAMSDGGKKLDCGGGSHDTFVVERAGLESLRS
jgi:hypothetical protein